MALPFLYPESTWRGLMCMSYITVKASLSGNEMGHMCEWGVFPMTAEQFRATQVLDLVPDFAGAQRSDANTPFCTYALAALSFQFLFLFSLLFLLPFYLLPSLSNIFSLCLLSYRPLYHLPPFHSPFSHIYTLFFSLLYLINFCFLPSPLIPSQTFIQLSNPFPEELEGPSEVLLFSVPAAFFQDILSVNKYNK